MIIEIVIDHNKARLAHRRLKERLARAFPTAKVVLSADFDSEALPSTVPILLKSERLIYRRGRETICDLLPRAEFAGRPWGRRGSHAAPAAGPLPSIR